MMQSLSEPAQAGESNGNIRVVREAGGLGDIVRIIPVLRGLREKYPAARLWVFAPQEYRPVLEGWFDEFRPTPWETRRPRDSVIDESRWPYLCVPSVSFDLSVDLYCPAFRYEVAAKRAVRLDRIDLFCRAAGVASSNTTPLMRLAPADVSAASDHIAVHRLRRPLTPTTQNPIPTTQYPTPCRLVALQPFSTDPGRDWPRANWLRLAAELERAGHRVAVMDVCEGRTRDFPQHRVVAMPLGFAAAFLAQSDLLICPDSGLGHLAAAVGTPAVGLFAAQSGALMYKHYPKHAWLEPPRAPDDPCQWPCYWQRRPQCARAALQAAGKTCEMLARIRVEEVIARVKRELE